MTACNNCAGNEWVCENHPDYGWPTECECGAGMPCGACNLEMASAGFVDRREKAIAAWLTGLEPHYSGWNPHDEKFDEAWNGAIEWVAEQLATGKHWPDMSAIQDRLDNEQRAASLALQNGETR